MSLTVEAPCGTEKTFDTRAEAEDGRDTHETLCEECSPGDCEIVQTDSTTEEPTVEQVDHTEPEETEESEAEVIESTSEQLPDEQPGVDTDPLDWVPGDFIDHIDGSPAINRKGYDVLAHHYGISVTTEVLVSPHETEYEYAEVVATAITEDSVSYTAHGSAHVKRGDDSWLLLEMADTRAAKRATARATGVGMVAVSELQNDL